MAHEIETVNGVARMIYRGERPWHQLGKEIPAGLKLCVDEALRMAEMADLGVMLQRLQLPDGRSVDCFATVRRDGVVVGSGMGVQYRVEQLETVFSPCDELIRSGLATIETVGSLKGGSRAWMLLKINRPDAVIVARADDRIAKYLLVATSFDGSISHVFQLTMTRVVCQNTLSAAFGERNASRFKIRHTRGARASIDAVTDAVEKADAQFSKVADMFRALARVQVTEKQVRAYIDVVFPPPPVKHSKADAAAELIDLDDAIGPTSTGVADFASLLNRPARLSAVPAVAVSRAVATVAPTVASKSATDDNRRVQDNIIEILEKGGRGLDMPGVKGTAWAAYNAVTEYLTWERGRSADNRMNALMFGDVGQRAVSAAAETFLATK